MKVVLAYLAVIVVWGTTPLGIKISVSGAEPFAPLIARTAIGLLVTLLCLAFLSERVRFSFSALKVYAASATSIVGSMFLTYKGATYIPSGMIAVIYGLSPILTGLLAVPVLNEPRLTRVQLAGVLLALAGLIWVFQHEMRFGDESWIGLLYLLAAVGLYAVSTVLVKYFNEGLQPLSTNAGSLLLALPVMVLLAPQADYTMILRDDKILYATLFLGVVGSFLGFVLFFFVLQSLSATRVMMIPLLTPVIALGIGNNWNGESIASETLLGSLGVVAGLAIYLLYDRIPLNRQAVNCNTRSGQAGDSLDS